MTAPSRTIEHASPGLMLLLGAMSAFPPVTTDIYLPALPELTHDLRGTMTEGQVTLAVYFVGLGFGQLFYGPWSDRIGRRPTMLIGAAIYLAASVGCAVAATMSEMIVLRFLQAVGACSGVVISTAVVRDRFSQQESARIFSMLLTLRGVGPIVAPLAGGVIVTYLGWRAIFWAVTLFGLTLGLAVLCGLRESRTQEVAARARTESPLGAYRAALGNRQILGYMLTSGLNFSCMFAWIAAAPYLVIGLYKVPALYFGWIFGANAAGFMIAAQVNRRLLKSYRSDDILPCGAIGAVLAAAVLLIDALTGFGGALGIFLPLLLVVSSLGFVSTNAMAGGLAVDPSRAGAVSALFGVSQFAVAGVTTAAAALLAREPALAMAIAIMACALGAVAFPLRLLALSRGWLILPHVARKRMPNRKSGVRRWRHVGIRVGHMQSPIVHDNDFITESIGLRPTRLEVNLARLRENYRTIATHVAPARVMPVLKANAYGHGLVAVAKMLERERPFAVAVAYLEEATRLREAGVRTPVLVLGAIVGEQIPRFIKQDLTLTASSVDKLLAIEACALAMRAKARVHLKVDTGMERIGTHWYSAERLLETSLRVRNVEVEGIFTHFANADAADLTHARLQLERFQEVLRFYERHSLPTPLRHAANSGAILQLPESHLDIVRPGILMFGSSPDTGLRLTLGVKQALRWSTRVVFFKVVKAGNPVSYGSTWSPTVNTRVITLPVGYGDGYMRAMSGQAQVIVRGVRVPVVGRICMDQIMADIANGTAYNGDEVVLLGESGQEGEPGIRIEEMAAWAKTIPHEILTNINTRVPRVYVDEDRGTAQDPV